jgi:hypothetical protein
VQITGSCSRKTVHINKGNSSTTRKTTCLEPASHRIALCLRGWLGKFTLLRLFDRPPCKEAAWSQCYCLSRWVYILYIAAACALQWGACLAPTSNRSRMTIFILSRIVRVLGFTKCGMIEWRPLCNYANWSTTTVNSKWRRVATRRSTCHSPPQTYH